MTVNGFLSYKFHHLRTLRGGEKEFNPFVNLSQQCCAEGMVKFFYMYKAELIEIAEQ